MLVKSVGKKVIKFKFLKSLEGYWWERLLDDNIIVFIQEF